MVLCEKPMNAEIERKLKQSVEHLKSRVQKLESEREKKQKDLSRIEEYLMELERDLVKSDALIRELRGYESETG